MYRTRFFLAGALIMLAIASLSALALSPSYLVLQTADGAFVSKSAAGISGAQQDRDAIIRTQALLKTLSPLISTTTPTDIIAKAIAARPLGIIIEHVTYSAGHPSSLLLSGTADTTDKLNTYQNILRADSAFTGVSVPVGDLAGTGDGQFSITLTGNF